MTYRVFAIYVVLIIVCGNTDGSDQICKSQGKTVGFLCIFVALFIFPAGKVLMPIPQVHKSRMIPLIFSIAAVDIY